MGKAEENSKPEAAPVSGRSIFAYPDFRKLFFGSLAGTFADRLYFQALIVAAYMIFKGQVEDKKGQIQLVATIPLLLLYPISGSLIDSFSRRRLLVLVKAIKLIVVLAFVPLIWSVPQVRGTADDSPLRAALEHNWTWCLWIIVLLNVITVPFGPARAAAVPDVVPPEHQSLGASLSATSGLMSLLLATGLGAYLATSLIGPALTIVVASGFYLCSAILFSRLPDSVARPLERKEGAERQTTREYVLNLYHGFVYCLKHISILGLIFFESVFWAAGSGFYLLFDFRLRHDFKMEGDALAAYSGYMFTVLGAGLFSGAISVGRVARNISPILCYIPAYSLIAACLYYAFRLDPTFDAAGVAHAPPLIYAVMFGLGLGGGMLLGRVDADVLAIAEERFRGRIFAIKAVAFAAMILSVIIFITREGTPWPPLSEEQRTVVTHSIGPVMALLLPLVAILSWLIDVAIWSKRREMEPSGGIHRIGYLLIQLVAHVLVKIMFRFEIVGREKIPKTGPLILAANHASFIDPILLGVAAPRIVQWIMYASYYRSFGNPVFRFLRCIPVDEKGQLAALKAGVRSLSNGVCIGIFPEGHVSDDGKLQPGQGGAVFLAQRTGATLVPVALKGNFEAFPRGAWFPRFSKIKVIVGTPRTFSKDLSKAQAARETDKIMLELAQLLGKDPPPKADAPAEKC